MRITSMDINNKEFKKGIRGYNTDEVEEFLDKIADDYEGLYKENSVLKEKVSVLEEKLSHYAKIEATIQNTLVLAQNAADQAKSSAQKEAELIIRNANDSAQRIMDKAHNDVIQINDEYERLKQEFMKFRTKFRNFMNSQFEMFESLEKEFIKNYNVGSTIAEQVKEKGIEMEKHHSVLEQSTVQEKEFEQNDFSEIKSFFAKE